jgi:hypothetical protein
VGRWELSGGVSLQAVTLYRLSGNRPRLWMLGWRCALHQADNLSRLGVSPHGLLGEDPAPIHFNFEHAAGRLNQLDVGVRVDLPDFGRQTGGPRLVVSDDAVFDGHAHA